jgi:hypothetical protein
MFYRYHFNNNNNNNNINAGALSTYKLENLGDVGVDVRIILK